MIAFRRRDVARPYQEGLHCLLPLKHRQHVSARRRIIARLDQITGAKIVGREFVGSGKALVEQECAAAGQIAHSRAHRQRDRTDKHARDRTPLAAGPDMAPRDMAHLMSQDRRQFRFVIHQGQQPARCIDIAAHGGEGVDLRRIEQRDGEILAGRRKAGLNGNTPSDTRDEIGGRPRQRSAIIA